MNKIKAFISLMRIRQWYKNLVIFIPVVFVGNLFVLKDLIATFQGFFALAFISSAGYVINDYLDRKKDANHPEKKKRPLASGKIKPLGAGLFLILLLAASLSIAWNLPGAFFLSVVGYFIATTLYTIVFKKILFADILMIGSLFVLRAVSGTFILDVKISPWLILCPFFLSLLLSTGKRHADLELLKDNAYKTRKILKEYKKEITQPLMNMTTTMLIISYSLYSFLSVHKNLIYTLPLALYTIFRYYYLMSNKPQIARHPEKIAKDLPMLIGILLWTIGVFVIIYVL